MKDVIAKQLEHYTARKAGCIFAAIAAKNPQKYGWHHEIIEADAQHIENSIAKAIESNVITTLSLIFPSVKAPIELIGLIEITRDSNFIYIEQDILFDDARCLGLRVRVNGNKSWVSGFGAFSFLPKTRQAPYVELVFRVKPRPNYEWFMKPPIEGVIHLADMDMRGIKRRTFVKWWNASLKNTRKILGHSPDLKSAAKTTYAIPKQLF